MWDRISISGTTGSRCFARGNRAPALIVWDVDGRRASYSFDEMATRSDQVGAALSAHGVGRGEGVVVMLDNQVELWETMLAVIKLGAVIMPTRTAARSAGPY